MSDSMTSLGDVQERLAKVRMAMVTTVDERGTLSARPLTVQKIDDEGDVWFLVDHNSAWVPPAHNAAINAAFSADEAWVSFAGRGELVKDQDTIDELMDPISSAFFDNDSTPVGLRVVADRIEWWTAPGTAVQLIELAKAKITGQAIDAGDSGSLEV